MGIDFKMIKIHQIVTDSGPICKKNSGEFMLQKFNIKNSSNGQGLQCSVQFSSFDCYDFFEKNVNSKHFRACRVNTKTGDKELILLIFTFTDLSTFHVMSFLWWESICYFSASCMLIDPNGYVVYSKQFMSSPRFVVLVRSEDIQCFHAGALEFYQATILTWKEILVYDDVSSQLDSFWTLCMNMA